MKYSEFLDIVIPFAETDYAEFQRRLIFTKYEILGVRTPILRKIAKECMSEFEEIFTFPNEYYEVVAIKLFQAATLPYEAFVARIEDCVALMDNWALCDSFKAKCIKKHKEEYVSVLARLFKRGGEYEQRYPLVALLADYVEAQYLPTVKSFIMRADTSRYYVHMAVAWLIAEILVKEYDTGVALLNEGKIDKKTHDKAIQKAIESYRIPNEQKEFLCSLKIRK